MNTFRIVAMEAAVANQVRTTRSDGYGNTDIHPVFADEPRSFPCRVCLEEVRVGDEALLFSYSPFRGRQTWGCYFGADGMIYASDLSLGFFIVDPAGSSGRGRGATALAARHRVGNGETSAPDVRVARVGSGHEISFAAGAGALVQAAVFDVNGRRVASLSERAAKGESRVSTPAFRTFRWNGRGDSGASLARGIYFIQIKRSGAIASAKVAHLGD